MKSVRDAFFNKIYDLAGQGEDIVVVTSDLGAPSLDDFRKHYPERYISVGIAEQNLITVAAGLSIAGKKAVAYGLNPFPVTRAYDQFRTLLGELQIPVTLCALNAGLCSAESGYTHMPVEDTGMTRMLSNVRTVNPSDETISELLAENAASPKCPTYVRFDKTIRGRIYEKHEIDFGKGFSVYRQKRYRQKDSCTVTVITHGCYVQELRHLAEHYAEKGVCIQLIDVYSLPVHEKLFIEAVKNSESILTVEENVLACGIGSMVLEILSDYELALPLKRIGLKLQDRSFRVFADRDYIRKSQCMDLRSIENVLDELIIRHGGKQG